MARSDQLEIIHPDGGVTFYDLDPVKGTTNIGSDLENNIVIDSPEVPSFLAMIDHRERPYQIMILDQEGVVSLDGQPLQPNVGYELHGWSGLEINGHSLVLTENGHEANVPHEANRAVAAAAQKEALPTTQSTAPGETAASSLQRLTLPPADQIDEVLMAELSQRDSTVECEQTATYPLTVINGGDIVAAFDVAVEGLEPGWVVIEPASVNLNEGKRATITVAITPPRAPASRAGTHHFAIVVTSPDHPSRVTRLGATININPFYAFAVSDLSPRQVNTGWRKQARTAVTNLTLVNKGNAEAVYRVDGEDDQHGCTFEYQQPSTGSGRSARQTELRLLPDTAAALAIYVAPVKRRLIGFRKQSYSLTVTSLPLSGQQTPRSVLGQLQAAPLIGPWVLLGMLGVVAMLLVLIFHPYINEFKLTSPADILGGQSATVGWNTSPFVHLKLMQETTTTDGAKTTEEVGSVGAPDGTKTFTPLQSVRYRLLAGNFLSDLFPFMAGQSEWVAVNVKPVPPQIEAFNTQPSDRVQIVVGETANLVWRVIGADKITLIGSDGLAESNVPTDTGSLNVSPAARTNYTLNAVNRYGKAERQLVIAVVTPTPTPVPKPSIIQFDVQPRVITEGQSVNITWEVLNAETIKIVGISGTDKYANKGTISNLPSAPGVYYQLIATNGPPGAESTTTAGPFHVIVNKAPPPPQMPVIAIFKALPEDGIVRGDSAQLQWTITGPTTDVTLSGPDISMKGLQATGSQQIAPDKTSLYILTAVNGPVNAVSSQTVKVTEPIPAPTIDVFSASPAQVDQGKPTLLSWTVSGTPTSISISSPDMSFVKDGLDPVGSLPVTPQPNSPSSYVTFILTVSYKDSAQKIHQLQRNVVVTVNLAPLPIIEYFRARCVSGVDCGAAQLSDDPTNRTITYQLYTGFDANLFWKTQNAGTLITITQYNASNTPLSPQPHKNVDGQESPNSADPSDLPFTAQQVTDQGRYYILTANNTVGGRDIYKLVFQLVTKPPQPPYSIDREIVSGQIGGTTPLSVRITWKYSAAEYAKIIGFRLKRSPLPYQDINLTPPPCTLDANGTDYDCSYTDILQPPNTCGIRYAVGALYLDIGGGKKETDYTDEVLLASCPTN